MGLMTNFTAFFILLIGVWQTGGQPPKSGVAYCSDWTPLDSKYFIPLFERHVPVVGCASRQKSRFKDETQVHILRLNTTFKEVMLHFNENDSASKGVILILDSVTTVKWRLSFLGKLYKDYNVILYTSNESNVSSTNVKINSFREINELKLANSDTDEDFLQGTFENFGGVTTFSRVRGANRISISLPRVETLPQECSISQASLGSSVLAYLVTQQAMFGCYHSEFAGISPVDVHVIDLKTADPDVTSLPPDEYDDTKVLPAVYLSLFPDQKETDKAEVLSRNLTLILKSEFPVRWYLESWGITGTLEVISNNGPVENLSLSSGQQLDTIRKSLPDEFDQLWKIVTSETGSTPVSYVKLDLANIITMAIPPRAKRGVSDILSIGSAKLVPDATNLFDTESKDSKIKTDTIHLQPSKDFSGKIVQEETFNDRLRMLENTLNSYLDKKCTDTQMIIATLPLSITNMFNVTGIRFQDHLCEGTKNETHWTLKTQSTSCGSISFFSNDNPMVRNNVFFKFSPASDFAKTTVRIPVVCTFEAGFPGLTSDSYDDEYEEEVDDHSNKFHEEIHYEDEDEMYQLKVSRVWPAPAKLLEHKDETTTVKVGDKILVETYFETRSFLSLALEECWLEDGSDSRTQALTVETRPSSADPRWLIWRGCPTNYNVTLHGISGDEVFQSFDFRIHEDHLRMGKVYLVCIIGLCAPFETGNIPKCLEPTNCTSESADNHMSPSAQQVTKRGPIFVIDGQDVLETVTVDHQEGSFTYFTTEHAGLKASDRNRISGSGSSNTKRASSPLESPSLHSSHVVMVGVPPEIAAVIAFASFIVGAALTGILCCAHHKRTLPKRNFHRTSRPDDRVEGSELQSMINTPTSQQPNIIVTA